MKKRFFTNVLWVMLLASLAAGLALPGGVLAGFTALDSSAGASAPAVLPWGTRYIQRQVDPSSLAVGEFASIAFNPVDNQPYIAYYDATNKDLMLASPAPANNGNCGRGSDWWCRAADGDGLEGRTTNDVGRYSSIAFWKGSGSLLTWKLGITYYDLTAHGLRYAVWSCIGSMCKWDYALLSTGSAAANFGKYTSLAFDSSGKPHVAYYLDNLFGGDQLLYAHQVEEGSGNCGPLNRWQCDVIDSGDRVGRYASLDLDYLGIPHIAYYAGGTGDLKYAHPAVLGNCGPSSSRWMCVNLDSAGDVGARASLAARRSSGGPIRVAYYDATNGRLKIATSGMTGNSGNCGPTNSWQCDRLDFMGGAEGGGISLRLDEAGYPFVAYQYMDENPQSKGALRIARPYFVYEDASLGNCGDVPPGYLFMYWRCTTLDGGGSWTEPAQHVSLAVDPSGKALVAYSETDEYYEATSLKLAYQRHLLYIPLTNR